MYVPIPNVFTVEGKEKLDGDEIYIYYELCLHEHRWFKNRIVISIDTIANSFYLMKNENQNKDRIYSVLLSLREKGVILFEDIDKNKNGKFKYNLPLIIHKQDDSYYFGREDGYKNGYEKIEIEIFDRMKKVPIVNRGVYFLVCCYILKTKRNVSYDEWSRVLGYDEKHVKDILYDMDDLGLIHRQRGRFYLDNGEYKQEINSYSVPDVLSRESIGKLNRPKLKLHDIVETFSFGDQTVEQIGKITDDTAWGKDNEDPFYYGKFKKLEYEDYEIYKICKENGIHKSFIKKCERVMNAIRNGELYDGIFETFEEQWIEDVRQYKE